MQKKMSGNWQGWLSYTYQKVRSNRLDDGLLNADYYTSWDQRNTFSLVTAYKAGKWAHTMRMDFGSGREDSISGMDPTLAQRANPYAIFSYDLTVALPKNSSLGNTLNLSIYNIFNNHQTLQYVWDSPTDRERYAWVPSRFISLGVGKSF